MDETSLRKTFLKSSMKVNLQFLKDFIQKTFLKDIFKIVLRFLEPSILHILLDVPINQYALLIENCRKGDINNVKYLVSHGVDIRKHNDFAFVLASENGHLAIVKYLVSLGANIHANNDDALRWGSEDVVRYIHSIKTH